MKAKFHSEALEELEEAVAYFKAIDRDLAKRFRASLGTVIASVAKSPLLGPIYVDEVRKRVLSDFPYVIFYLQFERQIMIVAVTHTSREPDYWLDRID